MPFVMVNCGTGDQPYALDADAAVSEDSDDLLEQCQDMEFLVQSCIDVLQEEEEKIQEEESKISSAAAQVGDFVTCQSEESISDSDSDSESDTSTESSTDPDSASSESEVVDCSVVISDLIASYQICTGLTSSEKYDDCEDVEETVEDAVTKCDESSTDVTADFCNTLTA